MGKFGQKNRNCQIKTKFDIYSYSLNSIEFDGDIHFFFFELELSFLGKSDPKQASFTGCPTTSGKPHFGPDLGLLGPKFDHKSFLRFQLY